MTVNKLIKLLQKAADDGYGRCPVCVDKASFYHPLEPDGAVILDVSGTRTESVMMLNDDGGTMHGKCGNERYRRSFVLHGSIVPCNGDGEATDPEWGDNQTKNPTQSAMEFLESTTYGHHQGRIVSSGDLSEHQIAEARAEGRFFVSSCGLGWALLPWNLTTARDLQRERKEIA